MGLVRIHLPEQARRGASVEARVLIQHPMETGFRRDAAGARVPRNAIHSFVCRYNGVEVFRATLSTGIAPNPLLRFYLRAAESGKVEVWWLDDGNIEGSASAHLVVV
jgi:sulfur-oxidizing protein SoxZ